jgi:hypothetical protein
MFVFDAKAHVSDKCLDGALGDLVGIESDGDLSFGIG